MLRHRCRTKGKCVHAVDKKSEADAEADAGVRSRARHHVDPGTGRLQRPACDQQRGRQCFQPGGAQRAHRRRDARHPRRIPQRGLPEPDPQQRGDQERRRNAQGGAEEADGRDHRPVSADDQHPAGTRDLRAHRGGLEEGRRLLPVGGRDAAAGTARRCDRHLHRRDPHPAQQGRGRRDRADRREQPPGAGRRSGRQHHLPSVLGLAADVRGDWRHRRRRPGLAVRAHAGQQRA